jgi:hypothetical protein
MYRIIPEAQTLDYSLGLVKRLWKGIIINYKITKEKKKIKFAITNFHAQNIEMHA